MKFSILWTGNVCPKFSEVLGTAIFKDFGADYDGIEQWDLRRKDLSGFNKNE